MNVLVIGNGGREHALAWKISQNSEVKKVFVAPFVRGKEENVFSAEISVSDFEAVENFVKNNDVTLVVIGPEKPLADGLADYLEDKQIPVFGTGKQGARLESSKIFAKNFMKKHNIPTAEFIECYSFEDVKSGIKSFKNVPVVKSDGLAAGKGVAVPETKEEALDFASGIFKGKYGKSSGVILEERLSGREVSFFAFCDGNRFEILKPSQDHKRLSDGDKGPNTGGMGAYTPVRFLTDSDINEIKDIFDKIIKGFKKENILYKGLLYVGFMMTEKGARVLEFNVRFGDPETQPLMMLMKSDILPWLSGAAKGNLPDEEIIFNDGYAVTVVMASPGYPEKPVAGAIITGLDSAFEDGVKIFTAGTKYEKGRYYTAGGRVLNVTAIGESFEVARKKAYDAVNKIKWDGVVYRKDIGYGF